MPGISSRIYTFGVAKQASKGTPAGAPSVVFLANGAPSLAPVKSRARFSLTDSGRDQGGSYTSRLGVEGDVPLYVHPAGFATLAYLALGANADTGSNPNYTHTVTPANDLPWFTAWRMVGNQVIERYTDCKLNALRVEGNAGGPLMATISMIGLTSTFLAADHGVAATTSTPYIYPELLGELKVATVAQKIHRFSFGIDNGLSAYQADDYFATDIDPGGRTITLGFATRFTGATAFPKYREFFYGSDAGTTLSPVTGTQAFNLKAVRDANTSVEIQLPQITYAGVPVQGDPGGAPIEVDVACEVEKPAASAICTIIVKDQTASV